jgi:hypothetical protein
LGDWGIEKFLNPRIDDLVKSLKTVTPAKAGAGMTRLWKLQLFTKPSRIGK